MQSWYRFAADLVLLIHVGFVVFVVVGQILIMIGGWRRWAWVRNLRFRLAHMAAIGFVVAQAWLGQTCPLTLWEMQLRRLAGEASYPGSFIAHWLEALLYYQAPPIVFTLVYSAFGLLVALSWWWLPPRRRRPHSLRDGG